MTKIFTIDCVDYREVSLKTVQQKLGGLHSYCLLHGIEEDSRDDDVNASRTRAFSRKHQQSYALQQHGYRPTDTLLIPVDCLENPATAYRAWLRYFDILTAPRQDYLWLRAAVLQIATDRSESKERACPSPHRLERNITSSLRNTEVGRFWLAVQTEFNPTLLFTAAAEEVSGTYYAPNTIHHRHDAHAPLHDIVSLRIHELAHRLQYAHYPDLYLPDLSATDSFVAMKLLEASAYAEEAYYRARKLADWGDAYATPAATALDEHRRTFLQTLSTSFMDGYEAGCLNDDLYDLICDGRIADEVRHSPFLAPDFLAKFCRPFPEEHGWFKGNTDELREQIIHGILDFQLPLLKKLHAVAPRTRYQPQKPKKLVAGWHPRAPPCTKPMCPTD